MKFLVRRGSLAPHGLSRPASVHALGRRRGIWGRRRQREDEGPAYFRLRQDHQRSTMPECQGDCGDHDRGASLRAPMRSAPTSPRFGRKQGVDPKDVESRATAGYNPDQNSAAQAFSQRRRKIPARADVRCSASNGRFRVPPTAPCI